MNEDFSLAALDEALFDVLHNTELSADAIVDKIVSSLDESVSDLEVKLERIRDVRSRFVQNSTSRFEFQTSENYDLSDGFEWTPLRSEDKINFNKYPNSKSNYKHSDHYWDTDRNR